MGESSRRTELFWVREQLSYKEIVGAYCYTPRFFMVIASSDLSERGNLIISSRLLSLLSLEQAYFVTRNDILNYCGFDESNPYISIDRGV